MLRHISRGTTLTANDLIHPDIGTPAAVCGNCGAIVASAYCGECGQGRHDHSRSLVGLVKEAAEHHFFLDGKSAQSLLALCYRPGALTQAYVEGRRMRFVSPLRVYLMASLVFFASLWLTGVVILQFRLVQLHDAVGIKAASPDDDEADTEARLLFDPSNPVIPSFDFLERPSPNAAVPAIWQQELSKVHQQTIASIGAGALYAIAHPASLNPILETWLPRLLVLLLPFTAATLALLHWRRRAYFIDHLSFAMHIQAFAFLLVSLLIAIRAVLPNAHLFLLMLALMFGYLVLAHRRVYRQSWPVTVFKVMCVSLTYGVLLVTGIVGILFYSLTHLAT